MTDLLGSGALRVDVLGPLRARMHTREIALGPPQQQAVAGVLATNVGKPVSRADLIDALWSHSPPANAAGSIHIYVAGLRRSLEPDRPSRSQGAVLIKEAAGYRLQMAADGLDAERLARSLDEAHRRRQAGELARAVESFEAGLTLCRGTPFAGVPGPYADTERIRLGELQQQVVEGRAETLLVLGRHAQVVPELTGLVERFPLRERLRCLLMLALYRCGRQTEALSQYQAARRRLIDELGIEPGPDLQRLLRQILSNDEELHAPRQPTQHQAVGPLTAPGADANDRGVAVAPAPAPAQLPRVTDKFTARHAELERLDELLRASAAEAASAPVAVITGSGGSGKTTLALHFARQVRGSFPDGQLYVDLHGSGPEPPRAPERVLGQILRALGVDGQALSNDLDELAALFRSRVADRRTLLILDDASDSRQVLPLLPGNGPCMVLVTSRNRLSGLTSLHDAERIVLNMLSSAEAVSLLKAILGAERVAAEPEAVGELARLCSHLPLALRIAADRLAASPYRTVASLTDELAAESERLNALALHGEEETPAVRAVFASSYGDLRPGARRAFRLLGLKPGPDTSAPAAAALLGLRLHETRPTLEALIDTHLLQESGPERYRLHDLLRLYARECAQQDEAATQESAVRRVLLWYLHTAQNAARVLMPHRHCPRLDIARHDDVTPADITSSAQALAWCNAEHENLVAAVEEARRRGEHEVAWRLPVVLWSYFVLSRPWAQEWIDIHRSGLRAAVAAADRTGQAWVLSSLGYAYQALRRFDQGLATCRRAHGLWCELGDAEGQAIGLIGLGLNYRGLGRFAEANTCSHQAADLWRAAGDSMGLGFALGHLGAGYQGLGRFETAIDCLEQSLKTFQSVPSQWGEATALIGLAQAYRRNNQFEQALPRLLRALDTQRAIHDRLGEGRTLYSLGKLLEQVGQMAQAKARLREALVIFEELRDPQAAEVRDRLARLPHRGDLNGAAHEEARW